jgi:hypothetical protein
VKTFPFNLATAEALPHLFTVVRGAETIRFTDWKEDLADSGGHVFTAEPGTTMTGATFATDGTVSSVQVLLAARSGGPLSDAELAVGRYDGCSITIEELDSAQPGLGNGTVFVGYIGQVDTSVPDVIRIEARGPLIRLRADVSERFGISCRADLGDDRCKVPILPPDIARNTTYVAGDEIASFVRVRAAANNNPSDYANVYYECTTAGTTANVQPTYDTTDGHTTTDGTAVFTARNAWLRYAQIASIIGASAFTLQALPDPRAVDDWFTVGGVILRSGRYDGSLIPVRKWTQSTLRVDTWDACSHMLTVNDWVEIYRGCQKNQADCNVFNNIKNMRAEQFVPGRDALLSIAQ